MQITAAMLRALGASNPDMWAAALAPVCDRYAINTRLRIAAFLANIMHETAGFLLLVESLNYTPDALLRTWPSHFTAQVAAQLGRTSEHPADEKQIAERAYGGRLGNGPTGSGEGWLYRGRGLIQLTGRQNYADFATATGLPLTDLPTLLQLPAGAADSAGRFWQAKGCNAPADLGDIATVRRLINGGENGFDDVQHRYAAALKVLPPDEPAQPKSAPTGAPPVTALPARAGWLDALLAAIASLFRRKS